MSETADLLESLRRRRGEREAASTSAQPLVEAPSGLRPRRSVPTDAASTEQTAADATITDESSAAPATTPEPTGNAWANQAARAQERTHGRTTPKRGRASMPSWDEIVFGARTDDDLG
jgi:hypothetical protein